nr:hypothetical protein [Enterocloster bolteae]
MENHEGYMSGRFCKTGRFCGLQIQNFRGYILYAGDPRVLASCLDGTYDEIIIDFGELRPSIRAEWLRCEVKIVMTALSEWKLEAFLELLSEEEGRRAGWIYTAAFGSEDTRKQIERRFGISLVRVPLSVDAFSVDYETMQWFERIL